MAIQPSQTVFSEEDMRSSEPAVKIGLLATINPAGLPHLTLISSLKAGSPGTVTWGQFTEGQSKQHIRQNPCTAFLIMTLDKSLWRGKTRWRQAEKGGPDFEWYNNVPMFRYNAYFGIHTVHYMDLIAQTGKQALPMDSIVLSAVKTMLAGKLSPTRVYQPVMNTWTRDFFNKPGNLKFLAFIDEDGYPWIIPAIQSMADGEEHLLFSLGVFREELCAIPSGSPVAVLGMALTMEDVLIRGIYQGVRRRAGIQCGSVMVDWVYNPMPPVPGQIYPPVGLKAVTEFEV